jgi:Tol biopolymer transport system component
MKRTKFDNIMESIILAAVLLAALTATCARKSDLEQGIQAMNRGEYAKAIKSFSMALEKDSLDPAVHYNLCFAYLHADSTEKALEHYLKLADLKSSLSNDRQLRELIAVAIGLEPYPASVITMRRLNQFKGAFNPSADHIVLAASRRDMADLYTADLDGSNMEMIVSGGMNTDPDISPDGNYVVFVSDRDGDEDLYLYDMASKEIRRITDNAAQDFTPSISPEGKEVVYVSNRDDPYKWEIYAIGVDDGRIRRLTDNTYWDGFPRFTANGQSIVFSSKRNGSEDIYVMRRDGGAQELLFSSPADDNDPTLVQEDLFFKSQMDGEWEIYQYNLRTKTLVRLTNNPWADWNPQISDDGKKMLVSRKVKNRWVLYFINLEDPLDAEFIVAEIKKRKGL